MSNNSISEAFTIIKQLCNNEENIDKITEIIDRIENLEKTNDKMIFSDEIFDRIQKHEVMNHHILIKDTRYKLQPVSILNADCDKIQILAFVEQETCCMNGDKSVCCNNEPSNRCETCPYTTTTKLIPLMKK